MRQPAGFHKQQLNTLRVLSLIFTHSLNLSYDIWRMLAGVAFFLLAMNFMEGSLQSLTGRSFKLFLKKHTGNPLKAVGGGALISALLQSSSIVNLLVLSMVGAGVVQMQNSLALILGSNLGTTFTSWLLAMVGFRYNIDQLFLPVVAISGIGIAFINPDRKIYHWLKFFFSLSFLFVSLSYIKSGMEGWVSHTDLGFFSRYPSIVFVLLGAALTGVVQSSSATMALTLSALHSGGISLYMAMGIILGSEIGTTLKLFIASANGLASKKRVALANFLINLVTTLVVWIILTPVYRLVNQWFGDQQELFALVFFQTLVNLVSLSLFLPFLKPFGHFLMQRYDHAEDESEYISKVPVTDYGLALEALEKETRSFINHVIAYSLDSFDMSRELIERVRVHEGFMHKSIQEKYAYLKYLHGEIHGFCLKLQSQPAHKGEPERLAQLMSAIRNSMYAAKNIQDAQHDILQIRNSSNDAKYHFYLQSADKLIAFYEKMIGIVHQEDRSHLQEDLSGLYHMVTEGYTERLEYLYRESLSQRVNEVEISTLINFNRELYTSFKSMVIGLKDLLLTPREAEFFDSLPGFIR